jgi:hypothetical protein
MTEPVPPTLIDGSEPEPDDDTVEPKPDEFPPDHPLVRTLAAQKAQIRELKTKANRLDQLEEATKSEAERATDRIAAETARADAAEAALIRYEVATEQGVPANAMKFLTGTTRQEIEASAKDVLELIGEAAKPRTPKPDPNQGRTPLEATSPASQFASFLSNQLSNT